MQMSLFAIATLFPVVLIGLSALVGGVWPVLALVYMTGFAALIDRVVPRLWPDMPETAEFPSGKALSVILGGLHFALLAVVVAMMADATMGAVSKIASLIAAGMWFGQVAHPNAHELIHRSARAARYLGRAIYGSLLFGHHASAHLLVHHVHVGTGKDPNSAPQGVGFYRFFLTSWRGSFLAGLRAENARRARAGPRQSLFAHPYLGDAAIACAGVAASGFLVGPLGLAAYLFVCFYAQMQILLSDYVQHYGLRRALRDTGKPEPVSDAHSWNSPHWFSSAMMVNAPRHSDHHLNPTRPYPGLRLRESMPILPRSLPVMAAIALIPPLWRRVMARALRRLPTRGGSA
jgi:alkane 1-monooxygenase